MEQSLDLPPPGVDGDGRTEEENAKHCKRRACFASAARSVSPRNDRARVTKYFGYPAAAVGPSPAAARAQDNASHRQFAGVDGVAQRGDGLIARETAPPNSTTGAWAGAAVFFFDGQVADGSVVALRRRGRRCRASRGTDRRGTSVTPCLRPPCLMVSSDEPSNDLRMPSALLAKRRTRGTPPAHGRESSGLRPAAAWFRSSARPP